MGQLTLPQVLRSPKCFSREDNSKKLNKSEKNVWSDWSKFTSIGSICDGCLCYWNCCKTKPSWCPSRFHNIRKFRAENDTRNVWKNVPQFHCLQSVKKIWLVWTNCWLELTVSFQTKHKAKLQCVSKVFALLLRRRYSGIFCQKRVKALWFSYLLPPGGPMKSLIVFFISWLNLVRSGRKHSRLGKYPPFFLGKFLSQKIVKIDFQSQFLENLLNSTKFVLVTKFNSKLLFSKNHPQNIVEIGSIFWGGCKCVFDESSAEKTLSKTSVPSYIYFLFSLGPPVAFRRWLWHYYVKPKFKHC